MDPRANTACVWRATTISALAAVPAGVAVSPAAPRWQLIRSGGPYAQSAARALLENTSLPARDIVDKALAIAADICIYTNQQRVIEVLE